MKCPHCLDSIHVNWTNTGSLIQDSDGSHWGIRSTNCPACGKAIIMLVNYRGNADERAERLVLPKAPARAPLSPDIPPEFSNNYTEACLVLADSPKASAALSRRCLQHLLREKAEVAPSDLYNEIQQVLDLKALPKYLAEAIDAVRIIGNFAAHPIKSKSTGEIVDVEDGEAEWLLDTLEGLFDFYFVQPLLLQKKKDALNQKLAEVGKPPLK
jgi:Domain of unknown function (DUF4145)